MARPKKTALSIAPIATDIFNDDRIVTISSIYGAMGELIALKVLIEIYRNGYYLEWSTATRLRLCRQFNCTFPEEALAEIVEALVEVGFFSAEMFAQGVLTSEEIQEQYFALAKRRKVTAEDLPYRISVTETSQKRELLQHKCNINVTETSQKRELLQRFCNRNPAETPEKSPDTSLKKDIYTKSNNNISLAISRARACASEQSEDVEMLQGQQGKDPPTLDEVRAEFKANAAERRLKNWEEEAQAFFDWYSVEEWKTSTGRSILRQWRKKVSHWVYEKEQKQKNYGKPPDVRADKRGTPADSKKQKNWNASF